jgi:hypothetical protein
MATDMRKTPSYLKGLAETRARADGEVLRLQRLLDDLAPAVAEARRMLSLQEDILAEHAVATTKRDACDTLIRGFDSRLDPAQIAPIRAFKGKYGKRGALRETLVEILRDASPAEVSTTEVLLRVIAYLKLAFATPAEKQRWSCNSLLSALKGLVEEGLVERLHEPATGQNSVGRWQWKAAPSGTLATLSTAAESAGLGVHQAKRRGRPRKSEQPSPELS